jgi:sulfopropanediol 3-dehydrogenase
LKTHLLPSERAPFEGADPAAVATLIQQVRDAGDAAVAALTLRFDGVQVASPHVPISAAEAAFLALTDADRHALQTAASNIRTFAEAQRATVQPLRVELSDGLVLGHSVLPTERVACYVPGGRYPLPSTVLMTAIPARVAGVRHVVVVSPPCANGQPSPWILAAAWLAQVDAVLAIGGVQAVAAVAYGTETIESVDLVVGPGNAWVTEAKRQVFGAVGIDALAGPSEVVILADSSADPNRVAADLLAQAEHDPHAEAIALTDDPAVAAQIRAAVWAQLETLPTAEIATKSINARGAVLTLPNLEAMIAWANERAPEHLHLHLRNAVDTASRCRAYGGLFIGESSAEVFGDYCSGVNHVLPTGGAARYTAGLSVMTYLRTPTFQQLSGSAAARLAPTTSRLARIEGLEAHARSADARSGAEK